MMTVGILTDGAARRLAEAIDAPMVERIVHREPSDCRFRGAPLTLAACDLGCPPPDATVVEVGSNDGTMLAEFARRGFGCLGIDPAFAIAWPIAPTTMSERDASWPDFVA